MKHKNLLCLFLLCCLGMTAHDFYLLPDNFFIAKGDKLVVHLYVGDDFKMEEERAVERKYTSKYLWIGAKKQEDMLTTARDSIKPFMTRPMDAEGLGMVAIERNKIHAKITMTPEKFTAYLKEEKLDNILRMRDTMPAKKEEREMYTRYLKTLVQVGNKTSGQYKQRLGHTLEIILLDDPYTVKLNGEINAQLFFKDKPLEGGSVEAICKGSDGQLNRQALTTDKEGKIKFKLDHSGAWIVRITHMIPSTNTAEADWESFWASYTFGVK